MTILIASESLPLKADEDVMRLRQVVRACMKERGFSLIDQTKLVTAASELGRNTLDYGGGGLVRLEILSEGVRTGVRLVFEDQGPGIEDITLALTDGYTTGGGLGLGLGGAKRLVNEFDIESTTGKGTRIVVTRWK